MKILRGNVRTGRREAAGFLALPWVTRLVREALGFEPYPGTLNLEVGGGAERATWDELKRDGTSLRLEPPEDSNFCEAKVLPVWIEGSELGGVVLPQVDGYPPGQVEVVAASNLRDRFGLADGSLCRLSTRSPVPRTFDAVLFDLEGTLVDFQWRLETAEAELRAAVTTLGLDPAAFADDNYAGIHRRALRMLGGTPAAAGIDRILGPIYDHYDLDALSRWTLRDGARDLLADLAAGRVKMAVVSNIGRRGVDGALEKFSLGNAFDTVITRNDVARMKPDGEGIGRALGTLGCSFDRTLMVGDSLSDLGAARDAGVRVAIVAGGESAPSAIADGNPEYHVEALAEILDLV